MNLWRSQDGALRHRDRQIEENIRMLCGQQWTVWNPIIGKFFDVSDWMSNAERRWRQRPVINRLLVWFILTHARLTENPPILTFLPGPDRIDADLAETMDTIFKITWRDADMIDAVDRLMAWMIPCGRAHLVSRLDLKKGPWKPMIGQADVPVIGRDGQPLVDQYGQPLTQPAENVPFDQNGQTPATMSEDGQLIIPPDFQPHQEREGSIVTDVLSALEVRGQWGSQAWHQKLWHAKVGFFTPEQLYDLTGQDVEPDTTYEESGAGTLDRVLFGSGFFGASTGRLGTLSSTVEAKDPLCTLFEFWEAPSGFSPEDPQNPGGRHIQITPKKCLLDGPRELAWPNVSPIRTFDFIRVPGRPSGTSPQEAMNGPQRSYNKLRAQLMDHANLVSNPKYVWDKASGISEGQWTNEPGTGVTANRRTGVPAVEWIIPPPLGPEVMQAIEFAQREIDDLGYTKGTQGEPLSPEQSGEAIKELRFNSDRFLGPTARRSVEEFARMAEDWQVLMGVVYDEERVLSLAGTDNIARTVTVYPMLFEVGKINVIPDVESMLPEGRGERQQQVLGLWKEGAFNTPSDPLGVQKMLELARFPNISRSAKPGGVDATTAEQENGDLVLGKPPQEVLVLPWYDHLVHLTIHEQVMKSREFLKYPPEVQEGFMQHRAQHILFLQQQMMPPQGAPVGGGGGANGKAAPPGSRPVGPGTPTPPNSVPASQYPTVVAPPNVR